MNRPHPNAKGGDGRYLPRLIAWEVTRSCPLACKHCRGAARQEAYEGELSTDECRAVLENIASFAKPIIILTGGEPLLRADIFDLAAYARDLGLRPVLATCGKLLDDEAARRCLASGVEMVSISLDAATAAGHDAFRGVDGAFDDALAGVAAAKRAGLGFQVNTTITRHNVDELPAIWDLAVEVGAAVFNPFLLVPTGRGRALAEWEISPAAYERTLRWLAGRQDRSDIGLRVTCAPHYQRILRQQGGAAASRGGSGCMGGKQFAFISHRGRVQICGFLDAEAGDLRSTGLDFRRIWETSPLFERMRTPAAYHGRCGYCEFTSVCGGCRARAYAMTGDTMAEEPFCLHEPARRPEPRRDETDDKLLSIIQADLPIAARPFEVLARRAGVGAAETISRINRLGQAGLIRRVGAVFDSRSLGYVSTLVAARVPDERLDAVAAVVAAEAGVTHCYRRGHEYNLWFTLTAPSGARLEAILADLAERSGAALHSLPALKRYKMRVNFPLGVDLSTPAPASPAPAGEPIRCDERQKALVRHLQGSLPLVDEPFAAIGERIGGWPAERVIKQVIRWREAGVIRRFGAVVNHRRLGFAANGMAVFALAADRIDAAGERLARRAEVSHCYRRATMAGFPYSLYAMIHGTSVEQVEASAAEILAEIGPCEHAVLYSTVEYKKTSMRYFLEDVSAEDGLFDA